MACWKPEKTHASRVLPETSTESDPAGSVEEPLARVNARRDAPDLTLSV